MEALLAMRGVNRKAGKKRLEAAKVSQLRPDFHIFEHYEVPGGRALAAGKGERRDIRGNGVVCGRTLGR